MKFSAALAFASTALAAPNFFPFPSPFGQCGNCVSQYQANQFVQRFIGVLTHTNTDLGNFTQTANALLADNFQEISGSINSLAGFPLDAVTTPSKEAYIQSVEFGPPDAGINTIFIQVANCNNILWHWEFTGTGDGKYPVKGFNWFQINSQCQCSQLQLEFNSIAWALDTGYQLVWPNGTVQS